MKTLHSTKRILCGLTLAAAGALAMLSTGAQAESNDTLAKIKQSGVISVGYRSRRFRSRTRLTRTPSPAIRKRSPT